ncbi:hypothetical protein GXW82_44025 [Streptacidiphilus sp. 4-A2]|nr:hypothetical protein [Streptacidiphilus sp. 4-A2]
MLLTAAFHERLDAPGEQGATGTLRRRPHRALEGTPVVAGFGASERRVLLEAASGGPDGWLLWNRVLAAAAQALEDVVRWTRPRAADPAQGVVVRDLLAADQRRWAFAALESVLGTEDD